MTSHPVSDVPPGLPEEKTPERLAYEQRLAEDAEAQQRLGLETEVSFDNVADVLSATIREDRDNAKIIFACLLLNYTSEDQQNIIMKASSSTGKTYLIKEVAQYFPKEDLLEFFNCTPKAFYYEWGDIDVETHTVTINLCKKILLFYDQRNTELLKELRAILSHDKKKLITKRTDKSKHQGHATKTIEIIGYPTLALCNADTTLNEQELTRSFIISPQTTKKKLAESIELLATRLGNREKFKHETYCSSDAAALTRRIAKIKERKIVEVIIPENLQQQLADNFLEDHPFPTPRNMRDFPRLIALIKASALLNCHNRKTPEPDGHTYIETDNTLIEANEKDVGEALQLYATIAESNELGLSPETYEFWTQIVQPGITAGLTKRDMASTYFKQHHRNINGKRLDHYIKDLLYAGLITEDKHPEDKRVNCYYDSTREINTPEGGTKLNTLY